VEEALFNWQDSQSGFSDCLIVAHNRQLGCRLTATFDAQAAAARRIQSIAWGFECRDVGRAARGATRSRRCLRYRVDRLISLVVRCENGIRPQTPLCRECVELRLVCRNCAWVRLRRGWQALQVVD